MSRSSELPRLLAGAWATMSVLGLLTLSPQAGAETIQCTPITALPATIAKQGVYCLTQDLATGIGSGNAVTVAANNVTIDCNGRQIDGREAGPGTTALGIYANSRLNITIRNCSIRGFRRGLLIDGATGSGHRIERNLFDSNTYMGARVTGDGVHFRGNRVLNTGGTSDPLGTYGGIVFAGSGGYLADNDVVGAFQTQSTEPLRGIAVNGTMNVIEGNRVSTFLPAGGIVVGLQVTAGLGAQTQRVVAGNSVLMTPGTRGWPVLSSMSDVCRDNVASGFDAAWIADSSVIYKCADAGGNLGLDGD